MGRRSRARRETSAGGVVVRCTDEEPLFLLINDAYHNWGFPKGHLDEGEEPAEAAEREVGEETGLRDLVNRASLGTIDWYFRFRGRLIHKYCHFFLFESSSGTPVPETDEGISECRWFPFDEAVQTISYDNARQILCRAGEVVTQLCREAEPAR